MQWRRSFYKFLFMIVVLFLSFFIFKYLRCSKTIEAALSLSFSEEVHVIHGERTKDGVIVFLQQTGHEDLSIAFVESFLNRYKVVYTGTQDGQEMLHQLGFTAMLFPDIKGVFLPVYVGMISDPDIEQIVISDSSEEILREAKIIDAGDHRIWLVDMSDFSGIKSEILITAYSKHKNTIAQIRDNYYLKWVK